MTRVLLEHVEKVFPNGFKAVDDFDLEIAAGELAVLVGPSGCGKTTTLRMIAGLETVTGGTITLGDRVVNCLPPKKRNVAMVFQNYALYPHLTAHGNMAFGLKLRKLPTAQIDQKVRLTAAILGIEELLDLKPGQLSGGQQQRVALGRAMVRDPACFLFDEPLSNLDAGLRVAMRAELKRLHRRLATTTLYVTHDQEEAMTLGDRVVVMRRGRIQQIGEPLEVFRHPVNRFVAGFLGSPPMNFLEGTISEDDGRLWFNEGTQRLAVPEWAAGDLAGKLHGNVVLGIRPENIRPAPVAGQSHNALTVKINLVEPLGDRIDVFLSTQHHPLLVARMDARAGWLPGTSRTVYLDPDRMHFFEPDEEATGRSGANLCLDAEKRRG